MWATILGFFSSLKVVGKIVDFFSVLRSDWKKFQSNRRAKKDKKKSKELHKTAKQMSKDKSDEDLKNLHRDLHK